VFTAEEIERARRYQRPKYAGTLSDQTVAFGIVLVLALGPPGAWLAAMRDALPCWAAAFLIPAAAFALLALAGLPFAFWSRRHELLWGFERRSRATWALDLAKAFGLGLALTALPLGCLVLLARGLPRLWPLVAMPAAAAIALAGSLLGPLLVEPLFARFRPLADGELAQQLHGLAERAGAPVRRILVADASRRSGKLNAYVSGLGRTRRLVLYDTLLADSPAAEIRLVVAHELGHRLHRHVLRLTLLAMVGAALAVGLFALLVSSTAVREATGANGAGDPRGTLVALALLVALRLVTMPAAAALSRRFERQADRASVELTQEPELLAQVLARLARANLADLAPPRLAYLLLFTHPTPVERIAAARAWAALPRGESGELPAGVV
jgi:STE24 endopeptidase